MKFADRLQPLVTFGTVKGIVSVGVNARVAAFAKVTFSADSLAHKFTCRTTAFSYALAGIWQVLSPGSRHLVFVARRARAWIRP